ncbi:hypothetical protein BDV95DRAFT_588955 [Massariosphaeria phaeospora]|uniref:Uncharacterized protein n=1 Tax=Massariosphaeria phaeospora TaxID=100035 RepID=A0A7C8MGU9_9PLEO|nr:hypothetical protein BDV95DRAFT_588955 [Massariosphaeria phaeospora]
MRPSTALLAAASLLGLAAASALPSREKVCVSPQVWNECNDGWRGCCLGDPCKETIKGFSMSACPNSEEVPYKPAAETPASGSNFSSMAPQVDLWKKVCEFDNSDCNWSPTFFPIKTHDETYTKKSTTSQFHIQKDDGALGARRDVIALFSGIPADITTCRMFWYKPSGGIFFGTWNVGNIRYSTLKLGGKPFAEAVGSADVSYKNTKALITAEAAQGMLDLGDWAKGYGEAMLRGSEEFNCAGSELAVHFRLEAMMESAVIVDQVAKETSENPWVLRAGWVLKYEW